MKKYFALVLYICLLSMTAHAIQRAVTDEGDIVILNENGTWSYENPETIKVYEIRLNNNIFKKSPDSTFSIKSTKNKSMFWIDPKKWSFTKGTDADDEEYTFTLKGQDLYGLVITEKVEIPLENWPNIALQNAKKVAPNMKIVNQEYRIVNRNKVLYLKMEGTIEGTRITFLGYYFSDSSGSTQYLAYTGSNLVAQYKTELNNFLNGFSIQ